MGDYGRPMSVLAGLVGELSLPAILAFGAAGAQDWISVALSRIHREYQTADIGRLVLLDQELRSIVSRQDRPKSFLPSTYLRPEYPEIGLFPAPFDGDFVTYSGKLLAEAHQRNPDSPFRSYTLYSTIFGGAGEESSEVPKPDAAERYLREFPEGPFVVEAHLALAHFYDDLHKLIRGEEDGERIGYKYDCYARYITSQPLAEQRKTAREAAIRHYERLVELLPEDPAHARYLALVRREENRGWFYCGD